MNGRFGYFATGTALVLVLLAAMWLAGALGTYLTGVPG